LKRVVFLAAICGLALGGGGCGSLPDVTNVVDLRVLAVKCEPAGFLVNLNDPGGFMADPNGADPATFTAKITALVADPLVPGGMLTVSSAVGCPDYIDTITSATGQGTKLCPPASAVSGLPDQIAKELATTTIVPPDMPVVVMPTPTSDIQFEPAVSFGLRPDQVAAFFSPTPTGIPQLDKSIVYNRDFSLPAIVNLSFDINGEHAVAIKNVVYWPDLSGTPDVPGMERVNTNPTLAGVLLYKRRNKDTGDPEDLWPDANPTISISAGDKLFVQPDYLPHDTYPGAADTNYPLRVNNTATDPDTVETKIVPTELIRFQFYTTVGSFTPDEQESELRPFLAPGSRLHTDAEYVLPKASDVITFGKVWIWVVTHDERAGSDWFQTWITLAP
jgi:hypothetical protein